MLKRSLHELTIATLFGSAEIAACLCEFLRAGSHQNIETMRPLCLAKLKSVLARDYLQKFRLTDIDRVCASLWQDDLFSNPCLPIMDELFQFLMSRNGDYLQYREEQVQAYARFSADIDPAILAGWHIAGWINSAEKPSQRDVERIVRCQYSFFSPPTSHEKAYAEGHVHWGGISADGVIIGKKLFKKSDHTDDTKRLYNLLLIILRSSRVCRDDLAVDLACAMDSSALGIVDEMLDWAAEKDGCKISSCVDGEWLRFQLALSAHEQDYATAWLWLVCLLWHLYRAVESPEILRVAIFYFFMQLTEMRRGFIMNGYGLKSFLDLPGKKEVLVADNRRRIIPGHFDVAEIKLTLGMYGLDRVAAMGAGVSSWADLNQGGSPGVLNEKNNEEIRQLERLHFCLHFIRSSRHRDKTAKKKPKKIGEWKTAVQREIWKEAEKMSKLLAKGETWAGFGSAGAEHTPTYQFHAARWVRGLDVAGDENLQRIEDHAPVLRWLRRGFVPVEDERAGSAGLHLSVHAGEDYAHPLSGLRHIDETVLFCAMRSGDRLGHALALGLEPTAWTERHGDMIVPVDEHLDNLVWVWHHACTLSQRLPLANQVLPRLARRIAALIAYVPWCGMQSTQPLFYPVPTDLTEGPIHAHVPPTPENLYQAWFLRRNCYYMYMNGKNLQDGKTPFAVPDYARLNAAEITKGSKDQAAKLYFEREAFLNLDGKQLPNVLIRVQHAHTSISDHHQTSSTDYIHDYDTPEELEFVHALQDCLMDTYDGLGLLIETNPTSNVYIAALDKYADHPIFRWSPPDGGSLGIGERHNRFGLRRGAMRVLINTDDPGIMPTTLRTEYALLLNAATDLGYSRTDTETWLERIRLCGLEQYRRNHLPVFTSISGLPLVA